MIDFANLLIDDPQRGLFRVNRLNMTSPEILELEKERIFDRSWLYVGHETEIPNPGDFRRRQVGDKPVMFVRGSDGQPKVFLNTCPHRGSLVCRQDEGSARVFECFYHGWTFNNDGELISVPEEEGYSEHFDKRERSLASPPRVEGYKGFYFLSYNPYAEDLLTYLADARMFIDVVNARGENGVKVLRGSLKYTIRANWKLLMENSLDGYHLPTTHATFLNYVSSVGRPMKYDVEMTWGLDLGNGHSAFGAVRPQDQARYYQLPGVSKRLDPKDEIIERARRRIIKRYGEKWAVWTPESLTNFSIYPNLVCVNGETWRTFWPLAPDQVEVTTWVVEPMDSEEELARLINNYPIFQGPGGFATPDDVEALESCQLGFKAEAVQWSDISRGMHRVPRWDDELQMRSFWRQWYAHLQGLLKAERTDDWESYEQIPAASGGTR
ncbi:MAG TPA: aromatic ring-hydroxylating dioxygenase subunit alpha [Dehalococcoidia bacterium]|nr:aromatic ring-hydroxylating dioxygenase subunit alpha [Dehalococcoidia bacterium]